MCGSKAGSSDTVQRVRAGLGRSRALALPFAKAGRQIAALSSTAKETPRVLSTLCDAAVDAGTDSGET